MSDATSTEKMQKLVQWLQRVRGTQVQSILLYGQMNSDIMVLNKTIQKIQTVNIGGLKMSALSEYYAALEHLKVNKPTVLAKVLLLIMIP